MTDQQQQFPTPLRCRVFGHDWRYPDGRKVRGIIITTVGLNTAATRIRCPRCRRTFR